MCVAPECSNVKIRKFRWHSAVYGTWCYASNDIELDVLNL